MQKLARLCLTTVFAILVATAAFAQGLQTGNLQGTVEDSTGGALPGVTVTVASPALQGVRTTVSDGNGNYVFRALPPGRYDVMFELSGFQTVKQSIVVELGLEAAVNATMSPAGVTEAVMVVANAITSAVASPTGGQNFKIEEINNLPIGRTMQQIATLAPGLTDRGTPNANQIQISGAFAYDNVFLIDGVDINDNLFGTANNLFIEDAIQETQVLTSGVSAEYGRFSGGVVNAVSKSGGNQFSGTFRTNLTNDDWTTRSPYEIARNLTRADKLNTVYEATFGGPIVRDRLWFFAAGRKTATENAAPLPRTGINFTTTNDEKRGEIKLTSTFAQNHTVSGSYFRNARQATRVPFNFTIDPNIPEHPSFPNDRWVASYRGVLGSRLFADLRWSQKKFGFRGSGGFDTAITASPFITITQATSHYNGNYFDATDPEDRDNWQLAGSGSYFLTTAGFGSHDLKAGFEVYEGKRTGGNSQTASGFVFYVDYLAGAGGVPLLDANGRIIPNWVSEVSEFENWLPTRGAELSIRTTSLYIQDRWQATGNLSFDLGTRFEMVKSEATGDIVGVDTSSIVPRLAATYDPNADGRLVLQATYAHYAGKYSEAQFGRNSPVGNPSRIDAVYLGPSGTGVNFSPGFNVANYEIYNGSFPTANVFFEDGLRSPITKEFTASVGSQIGAGFVKATFIERDMSNFVETFITPEGGRTTVIRDGVNFGTFDNEIYRNSDEPVREYRALQFLGRYTMNSNWTANGNYTLQLRNHGNFEGEATNSPAIGSVIGDRPELYSEARHYPVGKLDDFQRHKLRAWTTYGLDLNAFGRADVSFLYRYDSALAYSLIANSVPLTSIQRAAGQAAGYARLPTTTNVFFGDRGAGEFASSHLLDFGLGYQIPVFRSVSPFLKVDVFNITNAHPLIRHDITVNPDNSSPRDAQGLPTDYIEAASFGQHTSNTSYPQARTWQVAFGVRW